MKRIALTYLLLMGCLVHHVAAEEPASPATRMSSGYHVVLRQIASGETPLSGLARAGDFASQTEREQIVSQSVRNVRGILPSIGSLVLGDQQNGYAIDSAKTNLFFRRGSTNSVTAGRIPLALVSDQKATRERIVIWAQPKKSENGSVPVVWVSPANQAERKTWLSKLLSEVLGCKVDVVLINVTRDGMDEAVCRVRTGDSYDPFAKVSIAADGIEVSISTESPVRPPHPSPRGSDTEPIEQSPIIFPPGLAPDHAK